MIAKIDRAALAIYCQAWADYHEAVAVVRLEGKTFTTDTGYKAKNPSVTIMNEARSAVLRFAQEFGLTPSARARLGTAKIEKPDASKSRFFNDAS